MMAEKEEPFKIDPNLKRPWYFTNIVIVAAFLCVYPFALPLIWLNPFYSSSRKVLLTFLILVASGALIKTTMLMIQ